MKKRILQYGLSSNPGGIEVVALNIQKNINKEDFVFDYIIGEEKIAFEEEIIQLGGEIHKITNRKKNIVKHYKEMVFFFKNKARNYDVIHCSYCSLYSILPLVLSFIFGIPKIVLHARCSKLNTDKIMLKSVHYINRYIADIFATDFISVSEQAAELIFTPKRSKSKNYKVINNPLELEKFKFNKEKRESYREELGIENKFVVGHIGTFSPVKNHRFVLKVFFELQLNYPDSRLVLIGDGKLVNEVTQEAISLGIIDKVLFIGKVKNPYDYLQAMDVFVFPSLHEGFGNVLIEAQVSGLPCFVSNTVPKEVKITNALQFFSIQETSKYWAEKILRESHIARKNKFDAAEKYGFNIETCIENYEELYMS